MAFMIKYGTILPKIKYALDTFMLFRRMRVPCPRSDIKVLDMGIMIKNMENTSQAGTLCCTAEGILS
jgi:hypothetical protein